jgi:sugar porter (SP) family MFS transporter
MKIPLLLKSVLVASLGGLLFGFDTAVIAGATTALSHAFDLTPAELGFTVSSALWGAIIGALLAGAPGDRYGSRDSLRVLAVFYLISALGCALSWNWSSLLLARFLGGVAIGGSSVLGPIYIAELAPPKWRGRLVGLFQLNIVLGILLAYLSNYLVGLFDLGELEWRWKLGVAGAPALFFLLLLFGIPNSPRWLAKQGRDEEAGQVLALSGVADWAAELQSISTSLIRESVGGAGRLLSRANLRPVLLAVSIGCFNQLTGINAILYYSNDIFAAAGFDKVSSDLQSVAIGATNLVFTGLAMAMIDRLGRRILLLVGAAGMAVCLAGVAAVMGGLWAQSALIWLLMAFIAFFAFSQGTVIWVYLSEIFPTSVRAKGQSLGSLTHWLMNALISGAFPLLAASSGPVPFAIFSIATAIQFFGVLMFYPETAGKSLEDIQDKLT